jgi:hypothetical protein
MQIVFVHNQYKLKKYMKYLVIIIISFLSFSCQKEPELKQKKQDPSIELEKNFILQPVIWVVSNEDFEEEMLALMGLVDQALPGDRVEIRIVESGFEFTLIDGDGVPYEPTPSEIICVGSGAPFVRCVYSWMQVNPECCVVISPLPSGDPGFYANSTC